MGQAGSNAAQDGCVRITRGLAWGRLRREVDGSWEYSSHHPSSQSRPRHTMRRIPDPPLSQPYGR